MTVDLKGCHLRQAAHMNGGRAWFGYLYQCIEHPRLQRFDRYDKKTHQASSEWRVDGVAVADLDAAGVALGFSPVATAEEVAFLQDVPDQFTPRDGLSGQAADPALRIVMLHSLGLKGLIEWEEGQVRRTGLAFTVAKAEK